MKVYLAGPITGCSYKGAVDWREAIAEELLALGLRCASPMRGKDYLARKRNIKAMYEREEFPLSTREGIFGRDTFDVANCEILLANLVGADRVSLGTVMEIQRGFDYDRYVLVVMEKGNVHDHPFVHQAASLVVSSLEEAVHTLAVLSEPYVPIREEA